MSSVETLEKGIRYIRTSYPFSSHDEKHTRKAMIALKELIRIYERGIGRCKGHNWYPNNPEERAIMEAAAKELIKERSKVVRAAKRLLGLIA